MTLYEELKARGLVAQITDDEIIDLINNGKATFYIGFDCTADSLTAGHFMALTLMKRLQMAGNKPIALIGGGTTMIGDPSGRTDMRKMLTKEDIAHNAACFNNQSYLKISIRNTAGYSCHIRNNYSSDLLFADHIHNLIPLAINISLRKAIASHLSHD